MAEVKTLLDAGDTDHDLPIDRFHITQKNSGFDKGPYRIAGSDGDDDDDGSDTQRRNDAEDRKRFKKARRQKRHQGSAVPNQSL